MSTILGPRAPKPKAQVNRELFTKKWVYSALPERILKKRGEEAVVEIGKAIEKAIEEFDIRIPIQQKHGQVFLIGYEDAKLTLRGEELYVEDQKQGASRISLKQYIESDQKRIMDHMNAYAS